jgi:multidrug efflux pump subunit AcrA (membrane-fusion protein)
LTIFDVKTHTMSPQFCNLFPTVVSYTQQLQKRHFQQPKGFLQLTAKPATSSPKKNRKTIATIVIIAILAGVGGYTYYARTSASTQTTNGSGTQTAVAQRGNIVLTASGSGTLVSQTDATFGFDTSGQITQVYVKVGDQVEAGQVLAQLDNTLTQMKYNEAQQALNELYSAASIASVQQEIASQSFRCNQQSCDR